MDLQSSFFRKTPSIRIQWLVGTLGLLFMCLLGYREINGSPAVKDAAETLQMALDLERDGVISMDHGLPYEPSMMREPLPVLVTAASIYLSDVASGAAEPNAYFSGERVRHLKLQNLFWLSLLAGSTFFAIRRLTKSYWPALLGAALAVSPFTWMLPTALRTYIGVDSLCTDLAGAALLGCASLLLAVGIVDRNTNRLVGAGLCFGLLALTKAAAFYVFLGVLCCVAVYYLAGVVRRSITVRATLIAMGELAIPFLLVTTLWMFRNYEDTGFFAIAERGGPVLLYRAFLDDVTPEEFIGSFAVWGNPEAKKLAGRLAGYSETDLAAGGRLQRLAMQLAGTAQEREDEAEDAGRPDETLTWYRKSRAIYNQRLAEFTAAGHRYPSGAADDATKKEAFGLIVQQPFKHALLMAPLIWRGALFTFPLLVISLTYAWRRRRWDLAIYALPAFGIVLLYAGATHFSERYGYVTDPVAIVCLVALLSQVFERASGKARQTLNPSSRGPSLHES